MRNPSSSAAAAARGRGGGGGGKTTPCCTKVGLKRGPWTAEEDEVLASYIRREGEGGWRTLPSRAGLLRCGKSCRLRWMNYLRPSVKRGQIAPDEEDLILRLHRLLGNRWSLIAGRIPGRTDNEIKNYWNTHLSKKLIGQGIDPRTHKPLQLNPSSTSPSTSTPPAAPRPHPQPHPPPINDNNIRRHLRSPPSSSKTPNIPLVQNPNIIPPPPSRPSNEESPGFLSNSRTNPYLDEDSTGFNAATGDTAADLDISPGLRSSSKTGKGLLRLYNEDGEENEEEDDINRCCEDDAFSSFLNSLINEEPFAGQHQLVIGGGASLATATTTDALNISSSAAQAFGLIDPSWETTPLPTPPPSTLHDQRTDHQLHEAAGQSSFSLDLMPGRTGPRDLEGTGISSVFDVSFRIPSHRRSSSSSRRSRRTARGKNGGLGRPAGGTRRRRRGRFASLRNASPRCEFEGSKLGEERGQMHKGWQRKGELG